MVDPCIPPAWSGFSITFRHHSARYDLVVENPKGVTRGASFVEVEGMPLGDRAGILLADDQKTHRVRMVLG
jgi:cyclic beta-1,2-glucan glucanotransferase